MSVKLAVLSAFVLKLLLWSSVPAYADDVKRSSSGICHSLESPYYSRTKTFTPFDSLQACVDAGGKLPAGQGSALPPPRVSSHYSRSEFGHGWSDDDKDCQNARMEALISQSTMPVRFASARKCRVVSGRWISPFTGNVIHDAASVDIDHVVPLKWAWEHGAQSWTPDVRKQFANDPVNLWSVEASFNRQKGARGLDEWMPPAGQCQYIARFIRITRQYRLQLSAAKENAFDRIRNRFC